MLAGFPEGTPAFFVSEKPLAVETQGQSNCFLVDFPLCAKESIRINAASVTKKLDVVPVRYVGDPS